VVGGERRGGIDASNRSVAWAISSTAAVNASDVKSGPDETAATFLAYCSAAA
jgi:hypothetical protein